MEEQDKWKEAFKAGFKQGYINAHVTELTLSQIEFKADAAFEHWWNVVLILRRLVADAMAEIGIERWQKSTFEWIFRAVVLVYLRLGLSPVLEPVIRWRVPYS